jgi:hypothetical protein
MQLQEVYTILRQNFRSDNNEIIIPEINVRIKNYPFHSDYDFEGLECCLRSITDFQDYRFRDHKIKENRDFSYPVFLPDNKPKYDSAIILLHGLNEKNWNKYLPWGKYLSEKTRIPVILFPISFHINRAPADWSDPIKIQRYHIMRKAIFRDLQDSTFVNVAISMRLTDWPERFFLSGYQSLNDLIHLIRDIRDGNHPLFNKNTEVDFFAYSISILLVQCLIIANPENLLSHSRFFFFAGGSFFADMNGVSRYIMDSKAHERLKYYYVHKMEEDLKSEKKIISILDLTQVGRAFRSMMAPDRFRSMRESMFRYFNKDIFILGLKNDRVIPCKSTAETFTGVKNKVPSNMEICDPPYPYYHENPFPVKLTQHVLSINNFFEKVFTRAAEFLTYCI